MYTQTTLFTESIRGEETTPTISISKCKREEEGMA